MQWALTGFSSECLLAFLQLFLYFLRRFKTQIRYSLGENMFSSSMEQERLNSVSRVTKQMKRGANDFNMVWKKCHFLFELFKFNFIALPGGHKQNIVFFLFSYSPTIFLFHFYVIFISCYYNMSFLSVRQYFFSRFFKKHLLISWIRH